MWTGLKPKIPSQNSSNYMAKYMNKTVFLKSIIMPNQAKKKKKCYYLDIYYVTLDTEMAKCRLYAFNIHMNKPQTSP